MGSQVIVNGEVYDNLSAQDYYKMKDNLAPEVMKAFAIFLKKMTLL